jgi:hypothetical protein
MRIFEGRLIGYGGGVERHEIGEGTRPNLSSVGQTEFPRR